MCRVFLYVRALTFLEDRAVLTKRKIIYHWSCIVNGQVPLSIVVHGSSTMSRNMLVRHNAAPKYFDRDSGEDERTLEDVARVMIKKSKTVLYEVKVGDIIHQRRLHDWWWCVMEIRRVYSPE